MEYLKYYDLQIEPFRNDLDRRFYFENEPQRRARLRLLRAVQQHKGLAVLIGGAGCGKSTLAHHLLRDLDSSAFEARMLVVPHSTCAHGWLLPQMARSFGIQTAATGIPQLLGQVHHRLAALRAAGRHPVLFVDEAQVLGNVQAMEELRALQNLLYQGEKLVTIVLFGLPELSDVIRLDPPLAQRVEIRVELEPMTHEETVAYVEHRLAHAGATVPLFRPEAVDALYRYSGGVPRVVNALADNALFEGYLAEAQAIDADTVAAAAEQLGLEPVLADVLLDSPCAEDASAVAPGGPSLVGCVPIAETMTDLDGCGESPFAWHPSVHPEPGDSESSESLAVVPEEDSFVEDAHAQTTVLEPAPTEEPLPTEEPGEDPASSLSSGETIVFGAVPPVVANDTDEGDSITDLEPSGEDSLVFELEPEPMLEETAAGIESEPEPVFELDAEDDAEDEVGEAVLVTAVPEESISPASWLSEFEDMDAAVGEATLLTDPIEPVRRLSEPGDRGISGPEDSGFDLGSLLLEIDAEVEPEPAPDAEPVLDSEPVFEVAAEVEEPVVSGEDTSDALDSLFDRIQVLD